MDFALTDEQLMIQEAARQFAESELKPVAAELDKTGNRQLLLEKLKQLAELGFMGINIDPEYGGTGAGTVAFSLAITELARGCASTATTTSVTNMVAEVIQAQGNEAQKSKYLPKICSGEYAAGSFCLTESGSGSDAAAMRTRAVRDGDHYVLNGSKLFISSAEYAGVFVVWAVTDPEAPKGKGISCFLVEAGTPGLVIGKAEEKMGQKASVTNEVVFEECRIPAANLLGEENRGFRIAAGELAGGRIGIGSLALGIGLEALDCARNYIQEREQFGKKLAQFQGLQWQLADKYTEMEAARLLLMQAAWQKDAGMDFGPRASMAKLYASEKANEACYVALQMHGGVGYTREFPLERMSRDVRITTIYEGTSEIQRLIIARHLLEGVR
ncbi:acyl-CoA dehydrogenase family protein [Microbulbifer thermotolerans]|uniref:3-sulfinopropanoyl-CoA desulfinase n=1 Tax=Microbulbifer thermotolerans TaxID=252514 RepID=A0A143HL13_MICTH|nr:acyl-CoA dehydrogenase family protein [Microbulbifer thermotolerans]AMX02404.1 acyl-CoA dehydrogenase [Microbulbifer thermotolerans]MCX2779946.1 acyl-CoA dehydrogenase family protein [Microbulbifer thermotolerans]MCX2781858.1 acyl-CoA dehydrogenase family protein [Microbulbifer thermotolerans]MCX2795198.1 acyl-CoA dehydrogenase family protein [Microbulbifer thermotolerans]MCX2801772.1 acyl-CoA dehydrogenase family protein [Microbulbifer thermotolerans]